MLDRDGSKKRKKKKRIRCIDKVNVSKLNKFNSVLFLGPNIIMTVNIYIYIFLSESINK